MSCGLAGLTEDLADGRGDERLRFEESFAGGRFVKGDGGGHVFFGEILLIGGDDGGDEVDFHDGLFDVVPEAGGVVGGGGDARALEHLAHQLLGGFGGMR